MYIIFPVDNPQVAHSKQLTNFNFLGFKFHPYQ